MRQFQRKFLFLFALFEKEENKREKKTREVDRLRKDQRHLLRQKQKQKQRQRQGTCLCECISLMGVENGARRFSLGRREGSQTDANTPPLSFIFCSNSFKNSFTQKTRFLHLYRVSYNHKRDTQIAKLFIRFFS